jgi:hypothetical protein
MYPTKVMGEFDTVRFLIKKGRSVARFGDGELKILCGTGYVREPGNSELTKEMREIVREPDPRCLIAIPTMDRNGPKYERTWKNHEERFTRYFMASDRRAYGSAFITRPDSASDQIETPEYFDLLTSMWRGKHVAVLSESVSKLLACAASMSNVSHIECPRYQAYSQIDELERAIVQTKAEIALLSCGPTATCLANRLAKRGLQALDLGSIGGMLMRLMKGNA